MKLRAFSLIELSIVILIIGILVAGVTQGSRLVRQSKIKTAQTITQSSDINSIKDMVLWLDATDQDSLKTSTITNVETANYGNIEDGDYISQWKDRNFQLSSTIRAEAFGDWNRPIYTANAINGLPSIKFDGNDDELLLINALDATPVASSSEKFHSVLDLPNTVFVVGEFIDNDYRAVQYFIARQKSANNGGYMVRTNTNFNLEIRTPSDIDADTEISADGDPFILVTRAPQKGSSLYPQISKNGADFTNANGLIPTTYDASALPDRASIGDYPGGSGATLNGYISEIIIYNRRLKDSEVEAVENYLSKKYSITVSN